MPGPYLYPGVYVEEIPSEVRTITGVSTSDTAFIDFFARGPVDRAVRITSLTDFNRQFGGLDKRSEASYAIQQYYLNGGSVAWVVRVAAANAKVATRTLYNIPLVSSPGASGTGMSSPGASGSGPSGIGASGSGPSGIGASGSGPSGIGASGTNGAAAKAIMIVKAISPGGWGKNLQVGIDYKGTRRDIDPGGKPIEEKPLAFNMVVREVIEDKGQLKVQTIETYRNLDFNKNSPRLVDKVIEAESSLIRVESSSDGTMPAKTGDDIIGTPIKATWLWLGDDGYQEGNKRFSAKSEWGSISFEVGDDGTQPGVGNPADPNSWENLAGADALLGNTSWNRGIRELERIAPYIFNILCLPMVANFLDSMQNVLAEAAKFCEEKRAFLIVDIPPNTESVQDMVDWMNGDTPPSTNNAAVYFPRLEIRDPLNEYRPRNVGASGTLAGVYARTDATRGVWKAPAGTDASLQGVSLKVKLTDLENGGLNPFGINVLRNFPIFRNVSWGARTLEGADQQASEWKYIPVRRMALYIEESLYQGLKWVVFEPNDEPLWGQIRLNVGAFMHNLFRQGAFQGKTPREAYLVKCDKETTTQNDINLGIVNIVVGFMPLKPAEFVIIKIQQLAGQIEV